MNNNEKNIILFTGKLPDRYIEAVERVEKKIKRDLRVALIIDKSEKNELTPKYEKRINYFIRCNTKNKNEIKRKLKDIRKNILTMFFVSEKNVGLYCDILDIIKLKNSPTKKAIIKSTDKIEMRKAFYKYDPTITPKHIQVKSKDGVNLISKRIGFPCIIKPAHLSRSRLITVARNKEELKLKLEKIFTTINKIYNKEKIKYKPAILVEELMDGTPYTIDVYIDKDQKIYFTPLIYQITAKEIGIDDFHLFARINPPGLNELETKKAKLAVKKGVFALGLKNVVGHFELMKTRSGWKIIEVGPRIGAYRTDMLYMSYGIRHIDNYILLRLDKKPEIKNTVLCNSTFLEFFPKRKGRIISIEGINKVKKLKSFVDHLININVGEMAGLSNHGYLHTVRVVLKNKDKNILFKDIESARKMIKIKN